MDLSRRIQGMGEKTGTSQNFWDSRCRPASVGDYSLLFNFLEITSLSLSCLYIFKRYLKISKKEKHKKNTPKKKKHKKTGKKKLNWQSDLFGLVHVSTRVEVFSQRNVPCLLIPFFVLRASGFVFGFILCFYFTFFIFFMIFCSFLPSSHKSNWSLYFRFMPRSSSSDHVCSMLRLPQPDRHPFLHNVPSQPQETNLW